MTSRSRKAFFFSLTAEEVVAALEREGFACDGTCIGLNSFENRVYEVGLEDGRRVVAKFYRPGRWSAETILEEHRFLAELAASRLPVAEPFRLRNGSTLSETRGILFAVWPKVAGRIVDEPSDEDLQSLGRLMARVHEVGVCVPARHRPVLRPEEFLGRPLEFIAESGALPRHCRDRYLAAGRDLMRLLDEALRGVPIHRIHGDCHLNNLLRSRDGWTLMDFDDMLNGPAVQDLWMLAGGHDAEARRRWALLLDGYRRIRPFDASWLRLVEPLRGARFVRYAAWILLRWDDPAFPRTFPHFGTVEYWERETEDLEELLARILTGEGVQEPEEEEGPEPTSTADGTDEGRRTRPNNKEYFWDWEEPDRGSS